VGVNTVATKGMLGDLNPLGDSPCCGLADHGARVPEVLPAYNFLIVGGLYSVTALRKNNEEGVKVYTKHQDLTQASKHHKQMMMRYSPLRRVSASSSSSGSSYKQPLASGY